MSYFFHPAAVAEHLESIAYYESKRPGLGVIYLAEFENIMKLVCEKPHRYAIEKQPRNRKGSVKKCVKT